MASCFLRADDITFDEALRSIRKFYDQYPGIAPEVRAVTLLRQIDSWDEFHAILKALDVVITLIRDTTAS
jgi:hypothetical protein